MGAPSKQTLGMFALAGVVIAVAFVVLLGARMLISWNVHGQGLSAVTSFTGNIFRAIEVSAGVFSGHDETLALKRENAQLLASLAALEDVQEENEFLRHIADLPARQDRRAVVAGVFSYAAVGTELRTVINVGARDGIVTGSTVVTQHGALLGVVSNVRERSSTIVVLGDPSVQLTGRVMGTDIGGLVRVDRTGQLVLDLIGKDESVAEGQKVVASGLDTIPSGLHIGTVRSVDAERTTLFQVIRIEPAHRSESVWRVIVLIP